MNGTDSFLHVHVESSTYSTPVWMKWHLIRSIQALVPTIVSTASHRAMFRTLHAAASAPRWSVPPYFKRAARILLTPRADHPTAVAPFVAYPVFGCAWMPVRSPATRARDEKRRRVRHVETHPWLDPRLLPVARTMGMRMDRKYISIKGCLGTLLGVGVGAAVGLYIGVEQQ